MIYKEHTRNQKRMYRIHKQEERIQEQDLIIASLQQRIDKTIEYIKNKKQFQKGCDIYQIIDWEYVLEILGDKENDK